MPATADAVVHTSKFLSPVGLTGIKAQLYESCGCRFKSCAGYFCFASFADVSWPSRSFKPNTQVQFLYDALYAPLIQ